MSDKYLLNEKQQLLNNIGVEQAWGWSPAIDFCSLLEARLPTPCETENYGSACSHHEDPASCTFTEFQIPSTSSSKAVNKSDEDDVATNATGVALTVEKTKDEIEFDLLMEGLNLGGHTRAGGSDHPKDKGASACTSGSSRPFSREAESGASGGDKSKAGNGEDKKTCGAGENKDDRYAVYILLAGGNDIRHILRTISQVRLRERALEKEEENENHKAAEKDEKEEADHAPSLHSPLPSASKAKRKKRTYHFYLYEPNLRLHCRHLFFLQWLLNSMFSLEQLEERVLMFLDIFGNALIRDITAAQARLVVKDLLRALERGDLPSPPGAETKSSKDLLSFTSFSEMKLKERDFIEAQLRHWIRDASEAKIGEQWELRLRKDMAERFDNRNNLLDWDFVFRLTDYTNLIKFPEYRDWRNTGIAFDVSHINPRRGFDYLYQTPNKSLCHFDRQGQGYYCGDVKNGPFFSFGAQTLNEAICQRTADGTCKYGNGVIAMHNIRAWCYTLMTGLPWPWTDHKFAWDDDKHYNYLPPGTPCSTEYQLEFPSVQFHFVGLDLQRFLRHVREGKIAGGSGARGERGGGGGGGFLHAAFVGSSVLHELTPEFFSCFSDHAVIVAETAKFILDAEEEGKELFLNRILEAARESDWDNDVRLTAQLHDGQPKPKKVETHTLSKADEIAAKRYALPHQIALTKRR